MSLSKRQINSISREVYRQFPELDGTTPKVKSQSIPSINLEHKSRSNTFDGQRYLLTYQSKTSIPAGRTIMRVVRAVANGNGKLVKLTTSK